MIINFYSLLPADYFSFRYAHWTNGAISFSFGGFMSARGIVCSTILLTARMRCEYMSGRVEGGGNAAALFSLLLGFGATWQAAEEPWLYKDLQFSRRMNYGLLAESAIDCNLTCIHCVCFRATKFLLRGTMGKDLFHLLVL